MKATHKTDVAHFNVESDLLKELGERLVSDPEVALTELIKNAYDADASYCALEIKPKSITVIDDGHGITEEEFSSRWMTIATSNKLIERKSRLYKRPVTGSKGIGRFAARFLGKHLKLESVAYDPKLGVNAKLSANFDWKEIDKQTNLTDLEIPYEYDYPVADPLGTKLTITRSKVHIDNNTLKSIKTGSLDLESPLYNLIHNAPDDLTGLRGSPDKRDNGFSLRIESDEDEDDGKSLSATILSNYVMRAEVIIRRDSFHVSIYHFDRGKIYEKEFSHQTRLNTEVFADLYWFPQRSGVFKGKGIDGRRAWSWVRSYAGVAIFDSGFRMRPYGFPNNDWLRLDHDNGRNERHWQTPWSEDEFPMSPEEFSSPKLNPMLKLSSSYQMVGSVFVSTNPKGNSDSLATSMDRQGFTENEAFLFLRSVIRFAIEGIAHFDKKIQIEAEKENRDQKYSEFKGELSEVIKEINSSITLHEEDKEKLVKHYKKIRSDVENLEQYDRKARENLEAMSLLGIVAGFMTHEFQAALMELENAQKIIKKLASKDKNLQESSEKISQVVQYFDGYINYTRLFVGNLQTTTDVKPFRVLPAINYVLETFKRFQMERGIIVDTTEIDPELIGPSMPAAIYHGVFHNIYTNALKALINHHSKDPKIKILTWNDKSKHYLQIMDNGPGIPDASKKRIWDPMFTTTSSQDNPLGSGMGLGLPLVKKVVESQRGKVELIDPPVDFSTCFRVEFLLAK